MVSVIIPTTAEPERNAALHRAIASVLAQDCLSRAIVVVNGDRFEPALVEALRANPELTVLQLAEGNVSAARMAGLEMVASSFFCFLDDDDELLPGALALRVRSIAPEADILVTNGYRREQEDQPLVPHGMADRINADPVGAMLDLNWFASPAGLFRAATVPLDAFAIRLKFFEWTWLFFDLAARGMNFQFVEDLTYRKFENHDFGVSRSPAYAQAYAGFVRSLLGLPVKPDHRQALRRKYQAALNAQSVAAMRAGRRLDAWLAHARCLAEGGWRYVPYTRHLI